MQAFIYQLSICTVEKRKEVLNNLNTKKEELGQEIQVYILPKQLKRGLWNGFMPEKVAVAERILQQPVSTPTMAIEHMLIFMK